MKDIDDQIEENIDLMLFGLFFNYMKNLYGLVENEEGIYICDKFKVKRFSNYAILTKGGVKLKVSSKNDIDNIDKKIRSAKIRKILKKIN